MEMQPDLARVKIALFGFYKYGNFGDDLMAVLIAQELLDQGVECMGYGLRPEIAGEFGLSRTDSIDDLLSGSRALVFGGGGVFLRSEATEFHADIERICEICETRGIPIIMISVGGDGGPPETLPPARRRILRQARFISFRNQEDERLVSEVSGKHCILPDIVWTAAEKIPPNTRNDPRPIIAVDQTLMERRSLRWFLAAVEFAAKLVRSPYRFVFFSTDHDPERGCARCEIGYSGIQSFINEICSTSMLITPRLHAGLFALSMKIPVMLLAPHGKAKLLFERIGLGRFVFKGKWRSLVLALFLLRQRDLNSCKREFEKLDIDPLISEARSHFDVLRSEIK